MTEQLRYDNKVAIVTGAGGGLGKAYAKLLASRGAKVLVNDFAPDVRGENGGGKGMADAVVAEIKKAGGVAVANYDDVRYGEKVVKACVDAFGTVDIIINNAGILRDVSFQKMTPEDWDMIMQTHLYGTFSVTRAAWNILREKSYGRIIVTASSAGIYGSFGQVNYSTAKMGMFGLAQSLAKEGEKRNILTNAIAPLAGTRMTETVLPTELCEQIKPDYVADVVGYLVHDSSEENGSLFEVAGGYVAKMRWQRSNGARVHPKVSSPEAFKKEWKNAINFEKAEFPESNQEMNEIVMENLAAPEPANAAPVAAAPKSDLKSDDNFGMMATYMSKGEGKHLVAQLGAVYGFAITKVKN